MYSANTILCGDTSLNLIWIHKLLSLAVLQIKSIMQNIFREMSWPNVCGGWWLRWNLIWRSSWSFVFGRLTQKWMDNQKAAGPLYLKAPTFQAAINRSMRLFNFAKHFWKECCFLRYARMTVRASSLLLSLNYNFCIIDPHKA